MQNRGRLVTMPSYVAFLRAINLGAVRKFPKDAIKAATESIGAFEVETYINTGNVRLTTPLRSRAEVQEALEAVYLADRGFEVPTIAFTPRELVQVAEEADWLRSEYGEPDAHYITLFKEPPASALVAAAEGLGLEKEVVRVIGRAAHVLLLKNFHQSKLLGTREFKQLGEGTARNVTVIRTLAEKWC